MRTHSKLILAGLAATLLMSLAVGTASANRLSTSNRNFRVVWTELILISGEEGTPLLTCPVTMEGSFHSATIAKVIGALIGHVSRATTGSCRGGSATITQTSLPWHVTYEGFTGTLPNIREISVLLRGVNFQVTVTVLGSQITCGYGRAEDNARGSLVREAGGAISTLSPDESIRLQKLSGSIFCPGTGGFRSNANSVTLLGNTARITVRLI
jgi:hypothetical protein